MSRFRGLVYSGFLVSALLLPSAASAGDICSHKPTVYNTGTLSGTGSTCSDAQTNLESNLGFAAQSNCEFIYGENASVDTYTETLNACVQNGTGKLQTGSAQYTCVVCICAGIHCN